jgi:hypothetical protein
MRLSHTAEQRARRKSLALYYLDEFSILVVLVGSILLSEPMGQWAQTGRVRVNHLYWDWWNLILASVVAISLYGKLHTVWKYNDNRKPAWGKRVSMAVAYGVSWKTMTGWGLEAASARGLPQ